MSNVVCLDNIIFSLQRAGGISVVWSEHLSRLLKDYRFSPYVLGAGQGNIFYDKKKLSVYNGLRRFGTSDFAPKFIGRYLPEIQSNSREFIFHSSYYRFCMSNNAINVTTVHDFTYEYFRNGIAKYIHTLQKNTSIKKSNHIICVSESTKKDLLKFNSFVKESDISVVYNGVSSSFFKLNNDISLTSYGILYDKYQYCLYVGDRVSLYKNFKKSVLACKISRRPLVIVGAFLSKKEKDFLNQNIPNNYTVFTHVSDDVLNVLYNFAHCLLYPSSYEGFGIPIVEAQKAHCPVISTNNSSIPEVMGSGGIILDDINENAISDSIYFLDLFSNRKDIIAKGIQNSERFSWDLCYQNTVKVYMDLLNR